jgi:hypothetical protein
LDVRNCPNLGVGTDAEGSVQTDVDVSGCTNIEHIYFDGTSIKALTLPNGGAIKTLHLPGTITGLTIQNQTAITDFVLPDYSNITTLRLENVSNAIPVADILDTVPANSRVRLIGFDWSFDSAADIVSLCDRLDVMRGLDENGNNMDKAQVSGTVRVGHITSPQLVSIQNRYPNINVVYDNLAVYVVFYDETGENVLHIVEAAVGDNVVYPGETPTKENTAQYTYTFAGWSATPGGWANPNILNNITLGGNVYAVFTATVRTYTVRFINGSTVLQTVSVPYGGNATYTGDTPVKGEGFEDYEFIGWSPEPTNVTADMDCYAQYKAPSIEGLYQTDSNYTVRIMSWKQMVDGGYIDSEGKITNAFQQKGYSGDIAPPNDVTSIPFQFAYSKPGVTGVLIPNSVTTIGKMAFMSCRDLKNVTFAEGISISEIPNEAFSRCYTLPYIEIPDGVTRIGGNAFAFSSVLKTIALPASLTSIDYGFANSTAIERIDFAGTIAQWNAINKNDNWNYQHEQQTTVYCTDGTVIVPANPA